MKIYFLILLLILVLIIDGCFPVDNVVVKKVCFEEKCFYAEIADSDFERESGLMNRTFLDKNKGMFFIFEEEEYHLFWMKNTLIPLDIIWLDKDQKVVFIKENAELCQVCTPIIPTVKSKYVLEINAGLSRELNINLGDSIKIK